jgi:hypothetical protein
LTAVENVGRHDCLTLRPQAIDPSTANGQAAIYNKLVSSVPQLFFRSNLNQTPVQLSNANLNTIQTGAPSSTQSSFLAGPFTIYIGFVSGATNGQVITLTPSSTLIYVGLTTMLAGTNKPDIATTATSSLMAANQFTIVYNTGPITIPPTIYYTAVGV